MPSVSVIIPTYNRLEMLRQALDSVAAQTFADYEVLVVDDGSTEDIAGGVAGHPARPRVLRQGRSGPAAARNRGIREAVCDVVAFLDSDDLWLPEKLATCLAVLRSKPDLCLVYGPMTPMDHVGRLVPGHTKPCHDGWITEPLFHSSFVHVPTVVCRKRILEEAGGFNESLRVCEDYDLWLRLSVRHMFGLIAPPLAKRRLHCDRLSKSCMSGNLAVKADVLSRFLDSGLSSGIANRPAASRRVARAYFAAARAALRDGAHESAMELTGRCRQYGGLSLRLGVLLLRAGARRWVQSPRTNGSTTSSPVKPAPAVPAKR